MSNQKTALIIFGSPHQNGFTSNALKKFLDDSPEIKSTVFINAYKKDVQPCIACEHCKTQDGCIYDDMNDIDFALKHVDVIIFATPIYNLSLPAPMKAIFDRMQRYYSARFFRGVKPAIPKKKDGVLIVTSGSNDDFGIDVVIKQTKLICSIINCHISKKIVVKQTDHQKTPHP